MKKKALILASLSAFAGAAAAQDAVTIYGVFDGGVRYQGNVDAAGNSKLFMGSNGTSSSNRIGFKGSEDLGGGMNAHFDLETGFNSGTGGLDNAAGILFQRSAYVGLGGEWGSVDFGRQYTVAFKTIYNYDPFRYNYVSASGPLSTVIPVVVNTAGVRLNNDIQYTGTFGAWTTRAEYALGEVAGSTSNNSSMAVGLGYANGPLNVGAAYTKKKPNDLDGRHYTFGGSWKFGAAQLSAGYANDRQNVAGAADSTRKDAWVGLAYQFTPALEVTGAYYQAKFSAAAGEGKRETYIVGATYALSRRTNLYADIDKQRLDGTQASFGQTSMNGVSAGIRHLF